MLVDGVANIVLSARAEVDGSPFQNPINNVATPLIKPVVDVTIEDYLHLMSTNFELVFHLNKLAYPLLDSVGGISSISSIQATYYSTFYGASRSAMNQLTRKLACEWAKDNIWINGIALGLTRTPAIAHYVDKDSEAMVSRQIPLGRIAGQENVSMVCGQKYG